MTITAIAQSESRSIKFSTDVAATLVLLSFISFFFQNGIYIFLCLLSLLLIIKKLSFSALPNIFVFAMMIHWSQIVTYVFWMSYNGWGINHLSGNGGTAILLSLAGIGLMSLIFANFLQKIQYTLAYLKKSSHKVNKRKLLTAYALSTFLLSSVGFIFGSKSGLAQILTTVSSLKWVFFSWYAFAVLYSGEKKNVLLGVILFEFATGFFSYFSGFKAVIYFSIIIAVSFITYINVGRIIKSLVFVGVLFFIGLFWTAVKGDYRKFLNKGQNVQAVMVSKTEAYDKLSEEVSSLSSERMEDALNDILYRLQYTYHFAKTIDRVPSVLPFEYGSLWYKNISYVLVPRIINPEKPIYEATPKTIKYTGIYYAGHKQGASFSLGYFAECFVDFGPVLMFVPLGLLAFLFVFIFKVLLRQSHLDVLFRFSIINVCLFEIILFETDGTYLLGRVLMNFLVFYFLSVTFFPKIQNWLYK